jgi:hypothetical protein
MDGEKDKRFIFFLTGEKRIKARCQIRRDMRTDEMHTALMQAFSGWPVKPDMANALREKGLIDSMDTESYYDEYAASTRFRPVYRRLREAKQQVDGLLSLEDQLCAEHGIARDSFQSFQRALADISNSTSLSARMWTFANLVDKRIRAGLYSRFHGLSNGNPASSMLYTINKDSWEEETLSDLCSNIKGDDLRPAGAKLAKGLEAKAREAYVASSSYDRFLSESKDLSFEFMAEDGREIADCISYLAGECEEAWVSHIDRTGERIRLGFYTLGGDNAYRLTSRGYALAIALIRKPELVERFPDFDGLHSRFDSSYLDMYFRAIKLACLANNPRIRHSQDLKS